MTNRIYRVVLTDDANEGLDEIYEVIKEDSPQNAENVRLKILQKADSLEILPNRFSIFKPWRNSLKTYRSVAVWGFIIVYLVLEDDEIVVVSDIHNGSKNR